MPYDPVTAQLMLFGGATNATTNVGELWAVSANNDAIEQFAAGTAGNSAPSRVISGPGTGLVTPSGIALDPAGRAYVTEEAAQTIDVFPSGASGNVLFCRWPRSAGRAPRFHSRRGSSSAAGGSG